MKYPSYDLAGYLNPMRSSNRYKWCRPLKPPLCHITARPYPQEISLYTYIISITHQKITSYFGWLSIPIIWLNVIIVCLSQDSQSTQLVITGLSLLALLTSGVIINWRFQGWSIKPPHPPHLKIPCVPPWFLAGFLMLGVRMGKGWLSPSQTSQLFATQNLLCWSQHPNLAEVRHQPWRCGRTCRSVCWEDSPPKCCQKG